MIILFVVLFAICVFGMRFSHYHKDYLARKQTEAIKGIFAIIILFSHMRGYVSLSSSFVDESYVIILNMIGQLMVAIFFFYSGYGVIQSYQSKDTYVKTFFRNRIFKTWLHFAIVVLFYFVLSFIVGKAYTWQDYVFCWIGWTSVGNSNWFIFIALALYVLTLITFPIAEKFFKTRKGLAVSVIMCGFSVVFWLILYSLKKETWWYDTLLCYPFGMMFSAAKEKVDFCLENNSRNNYLLVIGAFVLFVFTYWGYYKIPFAKVAIYSICSCAFSFAIVMFTTKIKIGNAVLYWLGKNSFLIYILQRFPMIIFSEFGWNTSSYLFAGLSITTTLLLVPLFNKIYKIADKMLKKKEIVKMKKALVVGGNSGVGLSLVLNLIDEKYDHIYVVGKDLTHENDIPQEYKEQYLEKTSFIRLNLLNEEYGVFDGIQDIDTLIITAGFGRVAPFEQLHDKEIDNLIKCNQLAVIQIIKKYYYKMHSHNDFYTLIMGSIAGHVCSPLFSVYGSSKSGLCAFIENINAELAAQGYSNRILDVSPGSIKNTGFNGGTNNISALYGFTKEILYKAKEKQTRYIPEYDEIYKNVIARHQKDCLQYGIESYHFKMQSGRLNKKPQICVGYLSGTFDLFHIGHLNLLRKAKQECDYLIVGVHKDGSWKGKETFIPFDERIAIVGSMKYVDRVVESLPEDSDAYNEFGIQKLFVGSDYKGSERFKKYEEYFKDKNVEIIYFPYTQGTSSTQLRQKIKEK